MINRRLIFVTPNESAPYIPYKNQLSIDHISRTINPIDSVPWPIDLPKRHLKNKKFAKKNLRLWCALAPPVVRGSFWPNGQSCFTRPDLWADMCYVLCCVVLCVTTGGSFYGPFPVSFKLKKFLHQNTFVLYLNQFTTCIIKVYAIISLICLWILESL